MIDSWPATLQRFEIEIDESAGHHSWVLHHLASIHHLPFRQFKTFAVRRLVHPVARLPFPPASIPMPVIQKGYEPCAIPVDLLEAVIEGDSDVRMRNLCLDWWEIGSNELDSLVKACSGLQTLQVAISFPLIKMVSVTVVVRELS